jgi:hypothetical protein
MKFRIGETVRIVDIDDCYNRYLDMFDLLNTDGKFTFVDGALPDTDDTGVIVKVGEHEDFGSEIYLVATSDGCYLMAEEGLENV